MPAAFWMPGRSASLPVRPQCRRLSARCHLKDEGTEVDAVRPDHSAMVDGDLGEEVRVLQLFEYRPPEVLGQVDFAVQALVERQV